jgi:hypothetical protein
MYAKSFTVRLFLYVEQTIAQHHTIEVEAARSFPEDFNSKSIENNPLARHIELYIKKI